MISRKAATVFLPNRTDAGVDCFVKQHQRSLFVCFQGHPEYEAQSFVGRIQKGHWSFPAARERALSNHAAGLFRQSCGRSPCVAFQAVKRFSSRRPELLASFPVDRLAAGFEEYLARQQPSGYIAIGYCICRRKKLDNPDHGLSAASSDSHLENVGFNPCEPSIEPGWPPFTRWWLATSQRSPVIRASSRATAR